MARKQRPFTRKQRSKILKAKQREERAILREERKYAKWLERVTRKVEAGFEGTNDASM